MIISICLTLNLDLVFGQSIKCTLTGHVIEATSSEQLVSAHVYTSNLNHGTTTNKYGFFSLTLPCNSDTSSVALEASYVGYNSAKKTIPLPTDTLITFALKPVLQMQEIEVVGQVKESITKTTRMSVTSVSSNRINNTPVLLGEADVLKTLQLLPGVQGGLEGTSGLNVRGGSPDQNLILLDGVPVYNAYHLFGVFSVFNTDAVKHVEITKGGFPARYGGRLSSIVEVNMKEGNMKNYEGKAGIGLIASRLTFEGPIVRNKASFIVSARRTYLDLLTKPYLWATNTDDRSRNLGYYFTDVTGKVNYKINKRNRIYLSGYFGRDKFYSSQKTSYKDSLNHINSSSDIGLGWGNHTTVLRWNSIISDKLFSNTILAYSNYNFNIGLDNEFTDYNLENDQTQSTSIEFLSGVREIRSSLNFDYSPNSNHRIRFGLEGIFDRFKPEVVSFESNENSATSDPNSSENDVYKISTKTLSGWLEDDWEISERISINGGLRYTIYNTQGHLFQQLQPRFSARYQFLDNWSLKSSYAKTQQNVHLLTNSGINLPTDLWLPSTKKVPPEKAQQVATGIAGTILNGEYQVEAEGFYKWYDNLIEYKEGSSLANKTDDWESQVATQGIGWSYGLELFLRKQIGRLNGWASYTLSWSERQFDNINFGKSFPYKYDRRHNLKFTGSYKINDKIDFTAKWVFRTGAPTTLPLQEYRGTTPSGVLTVSPVPWSDYQSITIDNYGPRNTVRMRNYHRLDVSINFHKKKEHGERTWTIGLLNVYNRHNPFYMYLDYNYQTQQTNIKEVSLLPILPMVTYKFEFAQ